MRKALILVALALASCTVGPNYQRPEVALTPTWRNAAPGVLAAEPWWRAFNDPVLDGLEAQALSANLDVDQALARIAQARGSLRGANSALLPSGEIQAHDARVQQSLNAGLGQLSHIVPSFDRTITDAEVTLGGSWELDFAGGLRRQREGARANVGASEAELDATRLGVSGELADAYFILRGAQAQLAALQHLTRIAAEERDIVAARVRFKAAPLNDLRRADAALQDLKAQAPPLDSLAEEQRNRIAVLLGRDPSKQIGELANFAEIPDVPDPAAGYPADILRRRPDVRAAEQRLIGTNAAIGAALAEYYPKISLSGLIGQLSGHIASLDSSSSSVAEGVIGLRWRLFDFGRLDADVRVARGREREASAAYRQAILLAAESVETSFAQLAAARARLADLRSERAALIDADVSARKAYQLGEVSRDDALTADRAVARLDGDIATARSQLARAAVACNRAVGGPTQ